MPVKNARAVGTIILRISMGLIFSFQFRIFNKYIVPESEHDEEVDFSGVHFRFFEKFFDLYDTKMRLNIFIFRNFIKLILAQPTANRSRETELLPLARGLRQDGFERLAQEIFCLPVSPFEFVRKL